MKKWLKSITLLVLMICLTACSNDKQENQTVVIGFDNTFVPMGFLDESGEIVGFDVDLAKETFARLGYEIRFQSIDWSMKETELNSSNIDILWNGYSLTDERKKIVSYTDPYLENEQIIVTLNDSPVKTKTDLLNVTIGTQQGSASLDAIESDANFAKSTPILYSTFDQAFRDLEIGRIDAVVVDEILARYYLAQKGATNYKILDETFGSEVFVVAFRLNDTKLKNEVNETLNTLKDDGTFDQLYNKWFSN